MIKKILVPINSSENSDRVLKHSLDLADRYSAEIKLISIVQPVVVTGPVFSSYPTLLPAYKAIPIKAIENSQKETLQDAFEKAMKAKPRVKISKQLLNGRFAEKIVELEKDENFDLIVMSNPGTGFIKKLFLGNIVEKVIDNASCPVLVV